MSDCLSWPGVVIGGHAAGMSAAAKARRTYPDLEIVAYGRMGFLILRRVWSAIPRLLIAANVVMKD